MKATQWSAFLRKSGAIPQELGDVAATIAQFVEEPLAAAVTESTFSKRWAPGGPGS